MDRSQPGAAFVAVDDVMDHTYYSAAFEDVSPALPILVAMGLNGFDTHMVSAR